MNCRPQLLCRLSALVIAVVLGCATSRTTDTARTGIEQLLISNAIDQSLAKVDFGPIAGRHVFVQDKYLEGVDKNYVVGSIRHRILARGAHLVDKEDAADVILEIRSGGIGTDRVESFVGSPAIALPILPLNIPEVRLFDTKTQVATAKIGIVAYDAKTRQAVGSGGTALARANDINRFVFGVGPFNSGSVRDEVIAGTGQNSITFELANYLPLLPMSEPEPTVDYSQPVQLDDRSPPAPAVPLQPPAFAPPQVPATAENSVLMPR